MRGVGGNYGYSIKLTFRSRVFDALDVIQR